MNWTSVTGRTHLLGLLTAPAVPTQAPRALGVEEFAFRKGRRSGAVLVDVEDIRVMDVFSDREAATFITIREAAPAAQELAPIVGTCSTVTPTRSRRAAIHKRRRVCLP
ncbi:hypothetical protein [Streptomyces sp. NPDC005799]|uniref:hypothetical protein n=1 Tax=Streptomyces sp. NPDC005799 TaxID=3154678 RepID=UPI0033F7E36C